MPLNLDAYRNQRTETIRLSALMDIIPKNRRSVLDIGARDGFITNQLSDFFETVVGLDLSPIDNFESRFIPCVGNVANLGFKSLAFDTIVCTEVLEHVPKPLLRMACNEMIRVAKHEIVIGVPYLQDTRLGQTTCRRCGTINPPWGHVNSFSKDSLRRLFFPLKVTKERLVEKTIERTNPLSAYLMNFSGNPWGFYGYGDKCVNCFATLDQPPVRDQIQKIASKIALMINSLQRFFMKPKPIWIHCVFKK